MDETPIAEFRAGPRPAARKDDEGGTLHGKDADVRFERSELDAIFSLYGRMVAAGEWRDYAIDWLKDAAIFSVFRRASEHPLYRIEKHPRLRAKQGAYSVIAATGLVLKRGHDLRQVLKILERRLFRLVEA